MAVCRGYSAHSLTIRMENVMMKKPLLCFLFALCFSPVYSGIDDGFLTAEDGYQGSLTWNSYNLPLVVDGGGALKISVGDNGHLIVKSTSTPLQMLVGGVYDILLFNNAYLEYLNGATQLVSVRTDNATTILKGGTVNQLSSYQYGTTDNIFIYAQKDSWSWIDNDPLKGIQGNWLANGLPFYIEFINKTDLGFNPVHVNVKVIPEPASLLLFGFGGWLIRRKK